jgi:hypothetical protein
MRYLLAIALAKKLARIAWAALHKGRNLERVKIRAANNPVRFWLGGSSGLGNPGFSAALSARAGSDLVFVGGEGCRDFGFLALRDLREVHSPPEFR